MIRYDTVLFDLDGTLLNTLEDLTQAVNHAMREGGYPEHTQREVRSFVGNGVGMLLRRALPRNAEGDEEAYEEALQTFKRYYAAHNCDATDPYAGVCDMLQALCSHRVKLAIISNKNEPNVLALHRKYFANWVSLAVGERDGVRRIGGKGPHDIVGHDFCVGQRSGISGRPIVPDKCQIDILLLVQNPVDIVLLVIWFDFPEAEITIRVPGLAKLIDQIICPCGNLRIASILCEKTSRVDDFAYSVINMFFSFAISSIAKTIQPVAVKINYHEILVNKITNPPIKFAAEFTTPQCFAAKRIQCLRRNDITVLSVNQNGG